MRSTLLLLSALATLPATVRPALAQSAGSVPAIVFRLDPTYQAVVRTGEEERQDPEADIQWAERRSEDLRGFSASSGSRLLRLLADYAGASWPYDEIDVYLVRRFPTLSIQYPLTLTVGTIQQGQSRQDVPGGDFLILTLAHQLTHYLLDPPPDALAADRPRAFDHPLMEEGSYRREALVNLVAYRALEDVWGRQRLEQVLRDPVWQSYNPEAAFLDSLESRWSLSRSRPLATWLDQDDENGRLVDLAERMESARGDAARAGQGRPAGTVDPTRDEGPQSMAGTEIGFDLGQTSESRLFISFLDPGSPAEAAGLRRGEIMLTIEGRRFSSASEAMRVVEEAWRTNDEVNLSVERQGKEVFFQIH